MNKYKEIVLTSSFRGLLSAFKQTGLNSCVVYLNKEQKIPSYATQLERNSYVSFAKRYNLVVDEFFKPYQRVINFNQKKLALGDSAYINAQEIFRKLGVQHSLDSISELSFNDLFNACLSEVELFLQKNESLEHQIYALVKRHYKIYNLLRPIFDIYLSTDEFKEMLLCNSQLVAGQVFSNNVTQVEAIYYTLNLIGSYFEVDSFKLEAYLLFMLKEANKKVFKTNKIDFNKGSIVLDEVGLNASQFLVYDQFEALSFDYSNLTVYESLVVSSRLDLASPYFLNKVFFINSSDSFGSAIPHFEISFDQDCLVSLKYFYDQEFASKRSDYNEKAAKLLTDYIHSLGLELTADLLFKSQSEKLYCCRDGNILNNDNYKSISINGSFASSYINHTFSLNQYMGRSKLLSDLFN